MRRQGLRRYSRLETSQQGDPPLTAPNRLLCLLTGVAGIALAQSAHADTTAPAPAAAPTPDSAAAVAPAADPAAAAPASGAIVLAQAAPPPAAAAPATAPPPAKKASWFDTFTVKGQIEAGSVVNPIGPDNGINFGHLFTDHANTIQFNQGMVTFERDIDPKSQSFDFGLKFQAFYGTDARYTHFIGELDRVTSALEQVDITEANVTFHVPGLTKGGVDIKVGQYTTPLGVEVIDPSGNFFYTHSYIFNFGIPLKHTGILTTTHVSPLLDLYFGYDTGVNTSVGTGGGYNDARFHMIAGFGLNFSKVTVLALTHIGPELPEGALGPGVNVGNYNRYLSDIWVTWHINDKLSTTLEGNYITDEGVHASGGGVAQYFSYTLTKEITLGSRLEFWRDAQGFWVAAFPGNLDYINAETGQPNTSYGGGVTSYGAITLGLNIKPSGLPKIIDGLAIRPEVRWDTVLAGGTHPFNANIPWVDGNPGRASSQFTFGIDFVVPIH